MFLKKIKALLRILCILILALFILRPDLFEQLRLQLSIPFFGPEAELKADGFWNEELAPNYWYLDGRAQLPDTLPSPGEIRTSELDFLGRSGSVDALITKDMVDASYGWRESFSKDDDPSGWGHNSEVSIELANGSYYHGYFWNRSHLLADALGGHAERENLVCGTRMQNVGDNSKDPGGMAHAERLALEWIYSHPQQTLYYRATPHYEGLELVPRSVSIDIFSADKSIDQHIIVYNAAKGYEINYLTGTFHLSEES